MQIAEAHVHEHLTAWLYDCFCFQAINIGIDVIVDCGPIGDASQLKRLILVVEASKVEPQCSVKKCENGGAKLDHGGGGEVLLRAA